MPASHLTQQDRICIFHQKQSDFTNAEVARRLKRHRATVGRELKRFHRHPSWPYYRQYLPEAAHALAKAHRARPRGMRWTRNRTLLAYVLRGLRRQWSPQQITGRLVIDFPHDPKMRLSHQSVYNLIKADRAARGETLDASPAKPQIPKKSIWFRTAPWPHPQSSRNRASP